MGEIPYLVPSHLLVVAVAEEETLVQLEQMVGLEAVAQVLASAEVLGTHHLFLQAKAITEVQGLLERRLRVAGVAVLLLLGILLALVLAVMAQRPQFLAHQ